MPVVTEAVETGTDDVRLALLCLRARSPHTEVPSNSIRHGSITTTVTRGFDQVYAVGRLHATTTKTSFLTKVSSMDVVTRVGQKNIGGPSPKLERSVQLRFIGDWGQANFHRICGWLTQEVCDRAGPGSSVTTQSLSDGGISAARALQLGRADMIILTPSDLLPSATKGEGIFQSIGPMPGLRALCTLPQVDRMMLAVSPKHGVSSWADIHRTKPPLRIATSSFDGTSLIGFVAERYLEAHGLSKETLESWGGSLVTAYRPEQCTDLVFAGEADCLLQEAIMTPWWRELIERGTLVPLDAGVEALKELQRSCGLSAATIPAGFWKTVDRDIETLDFSDFSLLVREDLAEDIAHLLTWAIVNTRNVIESQYTHIPPERSPLSYPLVPGRMAQTTVRLHPGAEKLYRDANILAENGS